MTDLATIRATIRDTLAHHINLHRTELADLLLHDRGVFALHNRDERLAKLIGELATQIAQGLADLAELGQAAIAWAKADAECDAYIDQSISLAVERRGVLAASEEAKRDEHPLVAVTADAEVATLDRQIATVDNLIAFACSNVTKREARMKLIAKQLAEPPTPISSATAAADPIAQGR